MIVIYFFIEIFINHTIGCLMFYVSYEPFEGKWSEFDTFY